MPLLQQFINIELNFRDNLLIFYILIFLMVVAIAVQILGGDSSVGDGGGDRHHERGRHDLPVGALELDQE